MGYFDYWEYEIIEYLNGFIETDLSSTSVNKLLKKLDLTQYEISIDLREAKRILLVYAKSEYMFSAKDLSWISDETKAIVCSSDCRNIIFVDLDSSRDSYYLDSAAFIKNFNKAFPGSNCYVFKTCNGLAVGSMRNFQDIIPDNFCITQLFTADSMNLAMDFFNEIIFEQYDQIPSIIIDFSPQEKVDFVKPRSSIDEWGYSDDQNTNDFDDTPIIYTTYKETREMLKQIASDSDVSSLDILEEALSAEEMSFKENESSSIIKQTPKFYESNTEYSENTYLDAEQLLKEIMGDK